MSLISTLRKWLSITVRFIGGIPMSIFEGRSQSSAQGSADLPLRDSDEIQGNILAGFLKDHQTFIFLRFPDATRAKDWLADLVLVEPPRIASTRQVSTFNQKFSEARRNRGGDDPEKLKALWINLSLTHDGIVMLSPGLQEDLKPFEAFSAGPLKRADSLRDQGLSAPSRWVIGGPNQLPIHALLTVAADRETDLFMEVDKQRALAAEHGLRVQRWHFPARHPWFPCSRSKESRSATGASGHGYGQRRRIRAWLSRGRKIRCAAPS
jgi:hypothetical protein